MFLLFAFFATTFANFEVQKKFEQFKKDHGRSYESLEEERFRLSIFVQNLEQATLLNANPNDGAEYGITKFMDLTEEEFKARLGYKKSNVTTPGTLPKWDGKTCYTCKRFPNLEQIPAQLDWTSLGAVNKVKDQGQCGSCWTFSTVVGVEGAWFMAGNDLLSLSEEEIVQCDDNKDDQGCQGGEMTLAYQYVMKNGGLNSERAYPYTSGGGTDGHCNKIAEKKSVASIDGAYYISSRAQKDVNETYIMQALAQVGPLSIGINANHLQTYVKGVLSPDLCLQKLDHGVAMVGYGVGRDNTNYWKVRNSWGSDWGEEGYFRIARGSNTCGIADDVSVGYVTPKADAQLEVVA